MEELLEILQDIKPGVDFENETALIDNGVLDSLDIIKLVGQISDEFDVYICHLFGYMRYSVLCFT